MNGDKVQAVPMKRYLWRVPEPLLKRLETLAHQEHRSVNQQLTSLVEQALMSSKQEVAA